MRSSMILKLVLLGATLCAAGKDDKKWVWDESGRNARSYADDSSRNPGSRYNVYEELQETRPSGNLYYPGGATQTAFQQNPYPTVPVYQSSGPPSPMTTFLPQQGYRPGGVYATGNPQPHYGGVYYPQQPNNPGVLTGPVPSWVKEGPIKNFDKCKCTERFNCNSPGISYGHCDVGKQYCCYSTKKDFGGPLPSKPVHSIENGILVGPGGPIDTVPPITAYPRPPKQIGDFARPSTVFPQRPLGGNHYGRPAGVGFGGQNEYSAQNGVLVGPGGPFDRPNGNLDNFGLARATQAKKV
ncbi:uncharacterized protein LOC132706192 isoform X3 [Cylas formicarius]|uniref:uncharacterized protein LOC132706192 isoform X3 n=1 Tax=Cylas formicarius TaxID=197179 RepID=UPI0029585175|nr:uncharacterized protein LOC132706192 isoform X3 [Cylas formicarius]